MKRLWLVFLLFGAASLVSAASVVVDRDASRIEVDVKASMGSFVGELSDFEAEVVIDPEKSKRSDYFVSIVSLTIQC